jgi:hypothetical protein
MIRRMSKSESACFSCLWPVESVYCNKCQMSVIPFILLSQIFSVFRWMNACVRWILSPVCHQLGFLDRLFMHAIYLEWSGWVQHVCTNIRSSFWVAQKFEMVVMSSLVHPISAIWVPSDSQINLSLLSGQGLPDVLPSHWCVRLNLCVNDSTSPDTGDPALLSEGWQGRAWCPIDLQ